MSKINREEISQKVRAILCDKLSLIAEQVDIEENRLALDLGADSLDAVEVVMEFEREFEIQIPDELAQRIVTVKDCIDTVASVKNSL